MADNKVKKLLKEFFRKYGRRLLKTGVSLILLLMILAGAVYHIIIDDSKYKEGDWSSTPYAASEYVNGAVIDNNTRTIKTQMTAQELWDKMQKAGSDVKSYLKNPEELAKLMKAEMITQYPDLRENPDKDMDWEEVIKQEDSVQGIIKFKRAVDGGDKLTMSYVDENTFQGYIDEFNRTGSQTAWQNAITHFTVKKGASSTTNSSNNGANAIAAGEGVMTDVSQAIIDAIQRTPASQNQWCLQWVDDVYSSAGLAVVRYGGAYTAAMQNVISTDKSAIPIGAAVYGTGSGSNGDGHVGIYIGGGKVADSVGYVRVQDLEEWISWQTDPIGGHQGWIGWGWQDGNTVRGTTKDPSVTQNRDSSAASKENNTSGKTQEATERSVAGDGYNYEYTSSAGITYKAYKQFQGSYAGNAYWGGTISNSGCGPSSVANLASGLTNLNYNPGNVAAEMQATYGYTGAEPLKGEMDSLGMASEIIYGPSAQDIQDNLRNGKVMLVSVNSSTMFTSESHIMAIVDINESGQVYVLDPGSATLHGWHDISDITIGCDYIVITDAGASGIASTTNRAGYMGVVATWKKVYTVIKSEDPNVEDEVRESYVMSTTNVNYEEMVAPYTMPFDFLWTWLVFSDNKQFVFDLADLVYDSDIEITIYNNITTSLQVDEWQYTKRTKAVVNGTLTATCDGEKATRKIVNHQDEIEEQDKDYSTTKSVTTETNSVSAVLTRANVWIVDYQKDYIMQEPQQNEDENTIRKTLDEYPDEPTRTSDHYSCEHIDKRKEELKEKVLKAAYKKEQEQQADAGIGGILNIDIPTIKIPKVTEDLKVDYYEKYVNISDNIKTTTNTMKYLPGQQQIIEKTDEKITPNFVTLFKKHRIKKNLDAADWLFEMIEQNESTANMLDLVKYLLYKATGRESYGVLEYDFSQYQPGSFISIDGDYGDWTGDGTQEDFIKAVAPYAVIDMEQHQIYASVTIAQAIIESGWGKDNIAIQYKNFFGMKGGGASANEFWSGETVALGASEGGVSSFRVYDSLKNSIYDHGRNFHVTPTYSAHGVLDCIPQNLGPKEQLRRIAISGYAVYADGSISKPDGVRTYDQYLYDEFIVKYNLTQYDKMKSSDFEKNEDKGNKDTNKIVSTAKSKLGCPYVYGAAGPDTFDCSGLVYWVYGQQGISVPRSTTGYLGYVGSNKEVSWDEIRPGDIVWTNSHAGIYIGNDQYIHAPQAGENVKVASGARNAFDRVFRFSK